MKKKKANKPVARKKAIRKFKKFKPDVTIEEIKAFNAGFNMGFKSSHLQEKSNEK